MAWDKAEIREVLENAAQTGSNSKFVFRALQALYQRQTADEQACQTTNETNKVGFNSTDAQFLSDVAQKSQHYGNLTIGQTKAIAKCMKKYSGQLAKLAK